MRTKLPLNIFGIFFACAPLYAATPTLDKTGFPTTVADVPRDIRTENQAAGYKPYENASAYVSINNLETEEEAIERMIQELEAQYQLDVLTLSDTEFCRKYFDEDRCPEDRNGYGYLIELASAKSLNRRATNDTATGNDRNVVSRAATTTAPASRAAKRTIGRVATDTNIQPRPPLLMPQQDTKKAQQTVGWQTWTSQDKNSPFQHKNPFEAFWTIPNPQAQQNSDPQTNMSPTNNRKHDGPCTPSAISGYFVDKILTSGKYEKIDPAFEKMMIQIFRVEGECANIAGDPGGYTCYGLSSKANPDINFKGITRAKVEDITYERFYRKQKMHLLPDTIRGDVLRGDFGSGPKTGAKKLQKILGLPQTGNIDDELIEAVHNYNGNLHDAYWDEIRDFYVDIVARKPRRKKFLKGWLRGVQLFRDNGCHVPTDKPLLR